MELGKELLVSYFRKLSRNSQGKFKMAVLWSVTKCSFVDGYQRFGGSCHQVCLLLTLLSSTLTMEAAIDRCVLTNNSYAPIKHQFSSFFIHTQTYFNVSKRHLQGALCFKNTKTPLKTLFKCFSKYHLQGALCFKAPTTPLKSLLKVL
jgi:hypothetical protein